MEDRKDKLQRKIISLKEKLRDKYLDEYEKEKYDDLDKVALWVFKKHRDDKEITNQLNEALRNLTIHLMDYSNK